MPFRISRLLGVLALVGVVACDQAPSADSSASAGPLQGVWSLIASDPGDGTAVIDPSQPGIYIFAEEYYSAVTAPFAELRVPSAIPFQPSDEEKVAQYDGIIVNTGAYETSGSTVTFRPVLAKSPGFVGGSSTATFTVEGDMLTLEWLTVESSEGVSAPDVAGSITLRRVE
jgi:hypothetical protein